MSTEAKPVVDPVAVDPAVTASEASTDPIRPTGTDALTADSRPEVQPTTTPAAELPKEEKVGEDEVKIEAQPVAEGVLGYKAPGLIKFVNTFKTTFLQNLTNLVFTGD